MNSPFTFSVVPHLPPRIEGLRELVYNLWWSWTPEAADLYRTLDFGLWEKYHHNPVRLLREIHQNQLSAAAENPAFLEKFDALMTRLHAYKTKGDRWFQKTYAGEHDFKVAYFSAEFGIHEALPIYSGGLGILAGDHCKAASDLGLPFVAVGLLYRVGYFRQRINKDGWQESESVVWNFHELPITEVRDDKGNHIKVSVDLPGRKVTIQVWQARVGNISIMLLDTDVPENREEDRKITYQLYGGDHDMRIKQEIVLGIGGTRALEALGHKPSVYHMNEGHAAFLGLERIRMMVEKSGLTFSEALQVVAASGLFTTHTPVAAGNDAFAADLMRTYFVDFAKQLGISFEELLKYGRPWHGSDTEPFSMTILGLRLSRQCNGVSALHGDVSRGMWQTVWPGVPKNEIPITSITNGVHTQTWMSPEFRHLLEKYLGPSWEDNIEKPQTWAPVADIPALELWSLHQARKLKLIERVRFRVQRQRLREEASPEYISAAQQILSPDVLTIGFARRFATYKRANLLLKNLERLKTIMNNAQRPVQFVFAGKAHPADEPGKRFLQQIYKAADDPSFRNKLIFVEDYDIDLARYLISGVDVWLNNPIRPLEASGTSGQKGPINGGLNLSILDGWWCEGYNGKNGWAINPGVYSSNPATQDEFDAVSLYTLLEQEVVPRYYERDANGIPQKWVTLMKESMMSIAPQFSTFRMVQEYTGRLYINASRANSKFMDHDFAPARELSAWKEQMRQAWPQARVLEVKWEKKFVQFKVGEQFEVGAKISLGTLKPENVLVEIYIEDTHGALPETCVAMNKTADLGNGQYVYNGTVPAGESGSYRFNVRILPRHPHLLQKHELRLITWNENF
ncbi:MAG: alpha-glucan family phosphorylase [Verrucomicrobiae bacterium]|nr:alpha-glucan family phosphorylase [Verrucomicrobiae bacterium]